MTFNMAERKCVQIIRDNTIDIQELLSAKFSSDKPVLEMIDNANFINGDQISEKNQDQKSSEQLEKEVIENIPVRKGICKSITNDFSFSTKKVEEYKKDLCPEIIESIEKKAKIKKEKLELINLNQYIQGKPKTIKKKKADYPFSEIILVLKKVVDWREKSDELTKQIHDKHTAKEQSAEQMGIKRKSLDDYLMFLRKGILYKFPFEEKMNAHFGDLRKFVKERRRIDKRKWTNDLGDVDNLLHTLMKKFNS